MFSALPELRRFSDQTQEWFTSVRDCLENKRSLDEAKKLLDFGKVIGVEDHSDVRISFRIHCSIKNWKRKYKRWKSSTLISSHYLLNHVRV